MSFLAELRRLIASPSDDLPENLPDYQQGRLDGRQELADAIRTLLNRAPADLYSLHRDDRVEPHCLVFVRVSLDDLVVQTPARPAGTPNPDVAF